jgi:hypothetical protein
VQKATDDFRTNSLLEVYFKLNPTRIRSAAEVEDLDNVYKRGENVYYMGYYANGKIPIAVIDEDSDSTDEDPAGEALYYEPCQTCTPWNAFGYVCPIPVPTAPGQQISIQHPPPPGHTNCRFCESLMPIRGIVEESCASCQSFSCRYMSPCNGMFLQRFQSESLNPATKIDFDFDNFMPDRLLITPNCFNHSLVEHARFMAYKNSHNISTNTLRDNILAWYAQNPGMCSSYINSAAMRARFPHDSHTVDANSLLCNSCSIQLLTNHLLEWWAIQVNELHVIQGSPSSSIYAT